MLVERLGGVGGAACALRLPVYDASRVVGSLFGRRWCESLSQALGPAGISWNSFYASLALMAGLPTAERQPSLLASVFTSR
jgi:predicted aminopeptidase